MDSPNFWYFIWQLGTILDRNHAVPDRLGMAAHEILKIIESPLFKLFLSVMVAMYDLPQTGLPGNPSFNFTSHNFQREKILKYWS